VPVIAPVTTPFQSRVAQQFERINPRRSPARICEEAAPPKGIAQNHDPGLRAASLRTRRDPSSPTGPPVAGFKPSDGILNDRLRRARAGGTAPLLRQAFRNGCFPGDFFYCSASSFSDVKF
jgi:hypothetical protein